MIINIAELLGASKILSAGIATVGVAGSGAGIGIIFGAFLVAVSRHPELEQQLFPYVILGFALCESMAIFSLGMAFLLLYQ